MNKSNSQQVRNDRSSKVIDASKGVIPVQDDLLDADNIHSNSQQEKTSNSVSSDTILQKNTPDKGTKLADTFSIAQNEKEIEQALEEMEWLEELNSQFALVPRDLGKLSFISIKDRISFIKKKLETYEKAGIK